MPTGIHSYLGIAGLLCSSAVRTGPVVVSARHRNHAASDRLLFRSPVVAEDVGVLPQSNLDPTKGICMSIQAKTKIAVQAEIAKQRLTAKRESGRLRLPLIALTCGIFLAPTVSASESSEELTPMVPDDAEKALQFGDKKDLAIVIAIDEAGNHKIYRGKNLKNDGERTEFPIDAKDISSMDNITIFKTNPWYIVINGHLICI